LNAEIEEGWHIYSISQAPGGPTTTVIRFPGNQPFRQDGAMEPPKPHKSFDPNFDMETQTYEGKINFKIPVSINTGAPLGGQKIAVNVLYQTCDESTCLPPYETHLFIPVKILKDGDSVAASSPVNMPAAAAVSTQTPKNIGSKVGLAVGAQVPEFAFTDFNGKPRKFSEFRGHVVLIDFWATWCKPRLADIPHLKELDAQYRDKGLEIIGMDSETLGQDGEENDPEFAKERDARARQIVGTRGASWTHATAATAVPVAMKVFAVDKLPTKILIDAQGKIVARVEEGAELDQLLAKLLGEKQ
jgi:thiol-disulfide isomerase/thioredoxin